MFPSFRQICSFIQILLVLSSLGVQGSAVPLRDHGLPLGLVGFKRTKHGMHVICGIETLRSGLGAGARALNQLITMLEASVNNGTG